MVASQAPPNGDLAYNSGMYPDWESNQSPLGSQAGTQSTDPHQPGMKEDLLKIIIIMQMMSYLNEADPC